MNHGTGMIVALLIAMALPWCSLWVSSLFVRGGTEGLFIFLLCELMALVVICTGMILRKLDKSEGKNEESKEEN